MAATPSSSSNQGQTHLEHSHDHDSDNNNPDPGSHAFHNEMLYNKYKGMSIGVLTSGGDAQVLNLSFI